MAPKFLSRADILGADDLPSEIVDVPEWGGCVRVVGLTAQGRAQYESGFTMEVRNKDGAIEYRQNRKGLLKLRERLVAFTAYDEAGTTLLFEEENIPALGKKSAAALQRVFEKAQILSGMTKQDIEDLEKNFDETEEDDSPSVSQGTSTEQ